MSTRLGPGGFPKTGSNTYNLSLTEVASAAASQTGAAAFAPSLSEAAAASSAQSAAAHFGPSISEAASAAATATATGILSASRSETAAGADAPSPQLHAGASCSEEASAIDDPTAHLTASGSLNEAASAADHLSAIAHVVASLTEHATATDLAAAAGHYLAVLAETADAIDSASGAIAEALAALFAVRLRPRHIASAVKQRYFASTVRLQMPQGRDCSLMDVGETVTGGIDFAPWLASGVTIASIVSVAAVNYFPSGGSAYVTLTGSAQIGTIPTNLGGSGTTNTSVLQQWTGVAIGTARITIKITTSDGQTLEAWTHQPVDTPN